MYTQFEVESHFDGRLQVIFLNQPEVFNSLNKVMLRELRSAVEAFGKDETVRCIAISGRGKAFCAGQNLKDAVDLKDHVDDDREIQRIVIDYYNPLVEAITHSKKPIISLVNGPAVGAGAMLALITDFTLATESAYFSLAFANIGLIPDTAGTYYLPRLVGHQLASYLAFTGKKVPAMEAKKLGMIADVFPDTEFAEKSFEILGHLSFAATKAIGLTKKAFFEAESNTLKEQLDLESIYQQSAAQSHDFREGITAFLEKRKPNYIGK
ncbi:enoyl-CoA hydratase-related protein [Soonwooa sp.]|uniref:enoyl-CoA hydratase-related protein n=1 Tax=Soonwooa sp. TaxID=1938592 RepID=UPI0028A0EB0B|nr:enoyl-CoA hydratase-related protein [Soonwooa sp.]